MSDGTLLKYNFEDGTGTVVTDSSGRGLNGTASDAAVWSTAGRHGGALALNGGAPPTKFVSVPPGILKNVTNFSMAGWVKLNTDGPWQRIFDFGNGLGGTDTRFMFLTPGSDQGIRLSIFGGAGTREAITVTKTHLPLAVWKHVAVTAQDNGDNYIYVDGFPAGHSSGVIVPPSEMEPLAVDSWLGKSRFPDGGFDGLMDDFTLYDHVLTRPEIADLAWPKSDYSDWRFDEASGTKAADSSDRAIDAAFAGTAQWTSGRLGAGVALDGTTGHVSFASNPLAGCTTEATIAIWVKLGVAAQWARVFDFGTNTGDGATERFMFLTPRNATNALQFSLHTPTADMNLISNTTLPTDSAWHHVAVVISATAATVYLDGISVANQASPLAPSEVGAATQNWLGRSRFGTDPYLTGALDELRIACRAYTADEIVNLAFK